MNSDELHEDWVPERKGDKENAEEKLDGEWVAPKASDAPEELNDDWVPRKDGEDRPPREELDKEWVSSEED